jgi:hypothetical protein
VTIIPYNSAECKRGERAGVTERFTTKPPSHQEKTHREDGEEREERQA